MVPVFALVAGRLIAWRIPIGLITALGCLLCGLGVAIVVQAIGRAPDYATGLLPGWLIGGVGVGLALPTILSTAAADLPPHRFATGSAVVNMSRQIGSVLGVSLVVAVLGTPHGYPDTHRAFVHAWLVVAVFMAVGALAATGMTPRRPGVPAVPVASVAGPALQEPFVGNQPWLPSGRPRADHVVEFRRAYRDGNHVEP